MPLSGLGKARSPGGEWGREGCTAPRRGPPRPLPTGPAGLRRIGTSPGRFAKALSGPGALCSGPRPAESGEGVSRWAAREEPGEPPALGVTSAAPRYLAGLTFGLIRVVIVLLSGFLLTVACWILCFGTDFR